MLKEILESIGYIAQRYPGEVEATVPKLLINTKDKSTVIMDESDRMFHAFADDSSF